VTVGSVTSQAVLILTAALLFFVAFTDLKQFKIRNEPVVALAGLFFLYAFLSGRWVILYWNLGFAAALFLIMLLFYSKNMMGGGDLKLLTVAFLWVGPFCALPFALFLLFFACIHIAAVKFKLLEAQVRNEKNWIPFAPSIAGALIGVFILDCLRPL
jgi:prepilin peptidase CpaA